MSDSKCYRVRRTRLRHCLNAFNNNGKPCAPLTDCSTGGRPRPISSDRVREPKSCVNRIAAASLSPRTLC